MDAARRAWHEAQVARYRDRRAVYEKLAGTLQEILEAAAARHAPGAVVQARAKTIASFAEKILRKGTYDDPIRQLTDLAGARVVAYTQAHVDAVCRLIEGLPGIVIDRENSLDARSRLATGEFGYRAVHYVVSLPDAEILGVGVAPEVRGLRAEIQICTMLQHVWAFVSHDHIYKTRLRVPESLSREISGVAALLEICDARFGNAIETLDAYLGDFDAYLSPAEIEDAIARWEAVRAAAGEDEEAIHAVGRLLMAAGRWSEARERLLALEQSDRSPVLCDLGRAAWRAGFVDEGRSWLSKAVALDGANITAHCELGASHLESGPAEARTHYARAFALAPDEPRVLAPLIECEVRIRKDASALHLLGGSLRSAIAECERRARLGVHLPESHFERGRLALYLEPTRPYEALAAYCKALAACGAPDLVAAELAGIERMATAIGGGPGALLDSDRLQGFEWVRRLLFAGVGAIKAREALSRGAARSAIEAIGAIATPADRRPEFRAPIVIVAGGCDPGVEVDLRERFAPLLTNAFAGFDGTVIGGGTDAGVSGLVAGLDGDAMLRIGYLPATPPAPDRAHPAYRVLRTAGRGYTPLGPLQTWADLLVSGVDPADVRVVGINGGPLSAFEFRLALALGATAGIVEGSGRAASDMLADADWRSEPRLALLPHDWATLAAFIRGRHPGLSRLPRESLEDAARAAHEGYQKKVLSRRGKAPDAVVNWEPLPESLKESNRQQIAYAAFNLGLAGFDVRPAGAAEVIGVEPPGFEAKVEEMAEREHGRYVAERLADGWRRGEKNDAVRKTNPTLVPWNGLSDEIKQYDRDAVHGYAKVLGLAGLVIVPRAGGGGLAGVVRSSCSSKATSGGSRNMPAARRYPGRGPRRSA
jgi:ppGpp synthetase/RelA/SpoT-type nucleotidyltranferase